MGPPWAPDPDMCRVRFTVTIGRCIVQDLVPGFMRFTVHPLYGFILRLLGVALTIVGIIEAGLGDTWAGFTPVVWLLLALLAFLGVICNELAQIMAHKRAHWQREGEPMVAAPMEPASPAGAAAANAVDIYCVKCRDKRSVSDPRSVTLANGRPALQGPCPVCGTKLTRIVKAG